MTVRRENTDGFSGCLGANDVNRDTYSCLKHGEIMALDFRHSVFGERRSNVILRAENPKDFQLRIVVRPDIVNDADDACQACDREDGDIDRNDDFLRRNEGALRKCRDIRRSVDEDVIVERKDLFKMIPQAESSSRIDRKVGMNFIEVRIGGHEIAPLTARIYTVSYVNLLLR